MDESIARVLQRTRTFQQRFDAEHATFQPEPNKSVLAHRLLQLWAWGLISAPTLQWLAEGCVLDGHAPREVVQLAKIGANGQYKGNCRRDLLRLVKPSLGKPLSLVVPLLEKDKLNLTKQSVISPIQIFETFFFGHEELMHRLFGTNRLRTFWNSVRPNDPKLHRHPMLELEGWRDKAIPIVIHGDGAQFTRSGSLLVASWRPLLNEDFDAGTFLLFTLPKVVRASGKKHGIDSHREFWLLVVHLFNALFRGFHPATNHKGQRWPAGTFEAKQSGKPIADSKFFFVIWCLAGDLPYLAEEYGLEHCNANNCCWLCSANRSDLTFTDVTPTAAWRATLKQVTHDSRVSEHPIWDLEGVARWHVPGDLMHTGCLGVLLYILGSTLWELVFDGPYGGSAQARAKAVWQKISHKYVELGVDASNRLADLDLDRFRQKHHFPELRCKAAEARHLLPVLTEVCRDLNRSTARDLHRLAALDNLCNFYRLCNESLEVPLADVSASMKNSAEHFLLHYHWLAATALEQGRLLYPMTSKFHCFWHIVDMATFLNPTSIWCYTFESYIHKVVRSAQMCVAGTPMRLIGNKVAANFRLAFQLELGNR